MDEAKSVGTAELNCRYPRRKLKEFKGYRHPDRLSLLGFKDFNSIEPRLPLCYNSCSIIIGAVKSLMSFGG